VSNTTTNTTTEQVESAVVNTQQSVDQQATTTTTASTEANIVDTNIENESAKSENVEQQQTDVIVNGETTTNTTATKKSLEEILKENGYEEEIKIIQTAKEAKQKEIEEQEKPYSEAKEWAELISFSAKNKIANSDDFIEHKKINSEKNETLAFNKFKSEFVAPEGSEELDADELNELIVEQFNEKFFIGSENETLRKFGEKELESFANEVRKPINEKIATAQNRFASEAMYQQHQKALAEFNKNPQTVKAIVKDESGADIEIAVEITPSLEQSEVDAYLKSDEGNPVLKMVFQSFIEDREKGDKGYGAVLTYLNEVKSKEIINQKIAETAYQKGLEKAKEYGIGAKAPFSSKENSTQSADTTEEPVREFKSNKY